MPAAINWRHGSNGKNIDGATLPSGTGVRLTSIRHMDPPGQYEVSRLIPKPFWNFWGTKLIPITALPAVGVDPDPTSVGGWYMSADMWHLPEPSNAAGTAVFQAVTDTGDATSGRLSSARIWLNEVRQRSSVSGEAGAGISVPGIQFGPKFDSGTGVERSWTVQVATDPWLEVRILQGSEVLEHLADLESDYARLFESPPRLSMGDLPPDTTTYFIDRPLGDAQARSLVEPGDGIDASIRVVSRPDLRAAVCLCVTDLSDGSASISPPTFFTNVRDRVVATDLTFDMLSSSAREILQSFDEVELDVHALASRLETSASAAWKQLADAADELGCDSVSDAARFAGLATPAFA
jgi:hypothetical protein